MKSLRCGNGLNEALKLADCIAKELVYFMLLTVALKTRLRHNLAFTFEDISGMLNDLNCYFIAHLVLTLLSTV